jgi:hypothetical protein
MNDEAGLRGDWFAPSPGTHQRHSDGNFGVTIAGLGFVCGSGFGLVG